MKIVVDIDATKIRAKYVPDPIAIPKAHQHPSDGEFPVVTFDFNGSLTFARKYPIDVSPYPGCVDVLQDLRAKGCCLHITTAGLYFGKQDLAVFLARQGQIQAWNDLYSVPIGFVGGKVPADFYLADTMVPVPKEPDAVDWLSVLGPRILELLDERFALGDDSKYHRKPRPPVGEEVIVFPEGLVPLSPRGFSSVRLDADLHRTIFKSSSSTRISEPNEGAVEVLQELYRLGYTENYSCAGWSPLTHPLEESQDRYNVQIMQLAKYAIPYDRVVTRDFADVQVDDKGWWFPGSWLTIREPLLAALEADDRGVPEVQWPGSRQ